MSFQKSIFFDEIQDQLDALIELIAGLNLEDKIEIINKAKIELHLISPFLSEPVDCVIWVKQDAVIANDYNPNSVAPLEMKLLETSIDNDGYTQPIVSWQRDGVFEVVDGFHRHRVGKESKLINSRIHGYLPTVVINQGRNDLGDRMASTIRHNRARGEHKVDSMSEIIIELKRRFWTDEKIANELGMEPDEVLRLTQITGLAGLFSDRDFSEAWEATNFAEIEGSDINE